MSSAERGSDEQPQPQPSAEDVTDPTLQAEIGNPAASNPPTGETATPSRSAADRDEMAAPGAPGELTSDTEGMAPPDRADAEPEPRGDETGAEGVQGPDAVPKGGEAPAADAPAEAAATDATAPEQPAKTAETSAEPAGNPVDAQVEADAAAAESTPVEEPEAEPEPVDEARQDLVDALRAELGDGVEEVAVQPGIDLWVRVRIEDWRQTAEFLKAQGYTYFGFLSAIDWLPSPFGKSEDAEPTTLEQVRSAAAVDGSTLDHGRAGGSTRFQLLARVHSIKQGIGLTLKADLADDDPVADTWTGVYPGANWHEREAHEMFGIRFTGHPYLVKLYLPGAFEGYPLRKDFPLLAREVKPWPGLVDVEAMPGEPEGDDDDAEAAEASA